MAAKYRSVHQSIILCSHLKRSFKHAIKHIFLIPNEQNEKTQPKGVNPIQLRERDEIK